MSQVPTLGEIDRSITTLKIVLKTLEARQEMNHNEQREQLVFKNYGNAAMQQGIAIGMTIAETAIRCEIEDLEGLRRAAELYWAAES